MLCKLYEQFCKFYKLVTRVVLDCMGFTCNCTCRLQALGRLLRLLEGLPIHYKHTVTFYIDGVQFRMFLHDMYSCA